MMIMSPALSCSLKASPSHHHHYDHIGAFNVRPDCKHLFRYGPMIQQLSKFTTSAAKSGGFSLNISGFKKCENCRGQGAIECSGCKGTGKNKKNGNIFERWKCFECQGFGLKSCPQCGKGGLTPEQRRER